MSARNPDYEALRELQARSQEADRIGPEPERREDSNGPRSPHRELVARQ